MSDKKIISLAESGQPDRAVLVAASNFLHAILNQYPRAAYAMMDGVIIAVRTPKETILEIAGQAGGSLGAGVVS